MDALLEEPMVDTYDGSKVVEERPNQFVTFSTAGKNYGIDIMSVREIRSWAPTTELPGRSLGARGVLDIRGSIVEVFDLSQILGGASLEPQPGHVVLIVSMGDTNVGILVDAVSDIIIAAKSEFRDVPSVGSHANNSGQLSGLVSQSDKLIAILDLSALFGGGKRSQSAATHQA